MYSIMAESVESSIHVYDLEGKDFFTRFNLRPAEVIDNGVCGDIVLAIPFSRPDAKRVVKKFTLLDDENRVRNRLVFQAEVQFMKSFDHPFLMKCLIAAESSEYLAICMYYFPRGTLDYYVGNISNELIELCITQVACALRYMHKRNVAHLDVKLDNIFMDVDFNAVLGDFGMAEKLLPEQQTLTRKECGGTSGYFAPERIAAAADDELDPYKLDSYSLGVVLWALVTEKDPDDDINYYLQARKIEKLSKNIKFWLMKLLERNPLRRPTVTQMLIKVRSHSEHRNVIDNF